MKSLNCLCVVGLLCASAASAAPLYNIVPLGLDDPEHTGSNGYKSSFASRLNEAGQVGGGSYRYDGSGFSLGQSAWLYNGATTIDVGLTGAEQTRNNGYKLSEVQYLNEAGQVAGLSFYYNGGSAFLGYSAWLYNGTTTIELGFTGPEYTRNDGYKYSGASELNDAGQVRGVSYRYNGGSAVLGGSAWLYNGTTTIPIGLTGPEYTGNDGYNSSYTRQLNDAGQVAGTSARYNGGSADLGYTAWFYNGATTVPIGPTGAEYTRNDGYKFSNADKLNQVGQVLGYSSRYNGGADLGRSAWLDNGATTLDIGLTGAEHTRNDGYKFSSGSQLNEAGQVRGDSYRYNGGSTDLGRSAWFYNGATTIDIGFTGAEHTRNDGYKFSQALDLNEAGQVSGFSNRYNSGSTDLGRSAWLYNGAITLDIGLTGPEYTRSDGYIYSIGYGLKETGQLIGLSNRFNGSTGLGQSAWLYNGAATSDIGLTDAVHTRNDGYKYSIALQLNRAGQVSGYSYRYNGGSTQLDRDAWFYDPALDQTFPLQLSVRSDGYAYSSVSYLGDDGLALGTYTLFDAMDNDLGRRAFYFTVADGLHDLGALVDGGLSTKGWDYLASAIRENGPGQIIGNGKLTSSGQFAYLLTPIVPEPSTLLLLCLGSLAVLWRRRRLVCAAILAAVACISCDSSASAAPVYNIVPLGFDDLEHTRNDGYKFSSASQLNDAGYVRGNSNRYNGGSTDLGRSAWLYIGATTIDIGLTGSEHTRNDGYKSSGASQLNEAGQVRGSSARYNGGSTDLGRSVWLYDGATTIDIGLTGIEHTRNDGYKNSYQFYGLMNEAGHVAGDSDRYNGGSRFMGNSAWFYNGASTIDVGLTGTEHTSNDGYKYSGAVRLNKAGQVLGNSDRYNGGSAFMGYSAWLYDGAATTDISLTGADYTRNDGYRFSQAIHLNEVGQILGVADRYDGGSISLGRRTWLYNGATVVDIGLTGPEHTSSSGFKESIAFNLNDSGKVHGHSQRYNGGSTFLGRSAWFYDGANIIHIGLTGAEHTRNDGFKVSVGGLHGPPQFSGVGGLNEAGKVIGIALRFNGGSADLGQSAWLYDGATTIDIGLTGSEHTRIDGYKWSNNGGLDEFGRVVSIGGMNEFGQVIGISYRYNGGSASLGRSAWFYDGASTIDIGLTGSEHTASSGVKYSETQQLNKAGQVRGRSYRYNGRNTALGQDAWLYDPLLDQTLKLQLSTRSDGYAFSSAAYLGEDGLVLGRYTLFDALDNNLGDRAFYFTVANGLHDLGLSVEGGLPANGWDYLASAIRENGLGQIIGNGKLTSQSAGQMAYLLTPIVPEPSTIALTILGILGLLSRIRRRRRLDSTRTMASTSPTMNAAVSVRRWTQISADSWTANPNSKLFFHLRTSA